MSWKSFVSAGLLCLLASPAFAQPQVVIAKNGTEANGHLNADGDWAWRVYLLPDKDLVPDVSGTPMAAELGFKETVSQLLSVNGSTAEPPYATPTDAGSPQPLTGTSTGTDGDGFDTENPGNQIFTWEQISALGGTGECSSGMAGNCPVGIQMDLGLSEVFAALGSENFGEDEIESDADDYGWRPYIDIVISGPNTNTTVTTTIQISGDYNTDHSAGGANGRIAQITGCSGDGSCTGASVYITENFDTFNAAFTRTAKGGDANLDGVVDDFDLSFINGNWFDTSGTLTWQDGDFNGDGDVDDFDLSFVNGNWFDAPYDVGGELPDPGDGGGGGGAVPEPATVTLLALAGLGLAGLRRRRS